MDVQDIPNTIIVIEGIYDASDCHATSFVLSEALILRVWGKNPYDTNARTELVKRAEKASVDMS